MAETSASRQILTWISVGEQGMRWSKLLIRVVIGASGAVALLSGQDRPAVRIGIVSGPMGSFAATILKSHQIGFDTITSRVPGDSLPKYGVIVIDNLYRLQDINGAAFKAYVHQGGILLILNPKSDGFSQTWSPYDIFVGEYTIQAKILDRKHPLFQGIPSDKLEDFAESNGPYVGNCSFAEPAKDWRILARQATKGKNAVIVEARYGTGQFVLACTRFDHYNAKPGATRLGDNLMKYVIGLARR